MSGVRAKIGASVLALAGVVLSAHPAAAGTGEAPAARRVLVVTMPYVSWADVDAARMPELTAFAGSAGIADMATRIGRNPASLGDGYLTFGAGTRSISVGHGTALEVDEQYGSATAAEVFARRTGATVDAGIVHLDIAALDGRNNRTDYDPDLGSLGDELAAHGVGRAIVANGDVGTETDADRYRRSAVSSIMSGNGVVPAGTLAADALLVEDPAAPWGLRLDHDAVLSAFRSYWNDDGRRVVVVEASDLTRAVEYRSAASGERRRDQRRAALESSDALLGRLLDEVDTTTDAVVVVAPVGSGGRDLSLFAMAGPNIEPGFAQSATTRRSGFVQLADVAPTVLDQLGIDTPPDMEGRAAYSTGGSGSKSDRIEHLAAIAGAAQTRDDAIALATTLVTTVVTLLAFALMLRRYLPQWLVRLLPTFAVVILAVIPATYLTGFLDPLDSVGALFGAILVPAVVLAVVFELIRRRRQAAAVAIALATVVAVIGFDLLLGAHLQLNTLFGYSASVAGRFAGVGNLAFGFLSAATLLLAVTVSELVPGRRGLHLAIAVLVTGVLIDGLPMLGGDVGGIIAMVPAFGVTAMLLAGRRVRPLHVVAWLAAGGAVALVFGLIDLARPADRRTHLARFLERIDHDGFSYVADVVQRRWEASLGSPRTAIVFLLGLAAVLVAEYLVLRGASDRMRAFATRPARASMIGLAMLATVGLAANDSGIAVPGVMLAVAVPVAVLRADAWRVQGNAEPGAATT